MGYRLEISKVEYRACGGKLYGYAGNTAEELGIRDKLKSVKWLLDNNFVSKETFWNYGYDNPIILNKEEYKEFIKLYAEDKKEYHKKYGEELDKDYFKDAFELAEEDGDKLIEWY